MHELQALLHGFNGFQITVVVLLVWSIVDRPNLAKSRELLSEEIGEVGDKIETMQSSVDEIVGYIKERKVNNDID